MLLSTCSRQTPHSIWTEALRLLLYKWREVAPLTLTVKLSLTPASTGGHAGLFMLDCSLQISTGMKCAEMCCPLWCQQAAIPQWKTANSEQYPYLIAPPPQSVLRWHHFISPQWSICQKRLHNELRITVFTSEYWHTGNTQYYLGTTILLREDRNWGTAQFLSRTLVLFQDESPIKAVWKMHLRSSCMSLS